MLHLHLFSTLSCVAGALQISVVIITCIMRRIMQVSLLSLDWMQTGEADDGSHGDGGTGADDFAAAAVLPGPPEPAQPRCNQRADR